MTTSLDRRYSPLFQPENQTKPNMKIIPVTVRIDGTIVTLEARQRGASGEIAIKVQANKENTVEIPDFGTVMEGDVLQLEIQPGRPTRGRH